MLKLLRGIWWEKSGLAAIEFAFIAPLLITMVFGTIEVSNALNCKSAVSGLASTASDLVAQDTQVTNADMTNVFDAINSLLYPYPTDSTHLKIVISSIIDDGKGGGKVAWSDAQNTAARAVGSAVTVPTGLIVSGGSVILTEVTYSYTSASTDLIKAPLTMTNNFYCKPRRTAQITRTAT